MRKIVGYLLLVVAGLFIMAASVLSVLTVTAQVPANPIVPTALALLTQMPPPAVATQLAAQGYTFSPAMLATAQALFQQMPAPAVLETLLANPANPSLPSAQPTLLPPTPLPTTIAQPNPAQPAAPAGQPMAQPGQSVPVQPPLAVMPTTTLAAPMPVGQISGTALRGETADASGIQLRLTRPDGTTLTLPVGADGRFAFANMPPGAYTLEAGAAGYLSGKATFTLQAGQNLTLTALSLPAGDVNGDNRIDEADAALLGANFDAPPPMPGADMNGDGWIDVHDLVLLSNAVGLTGPLVWN